MSEHRDDTWFRSPTATLASHLDAPREPVIIELLPDDAPRWRLRDPQLVLGLLRDAQDMRVGTLHVATELGEEESRRYWLELGDDPDHPALAGSAGVWVTEVPLVLVRGRGAWIVQLDDDGLETAMHETLDTRAWLLEMLVEACGAEAAEDVPLGTVTLVVERDVAPDEVAAVAPHQVVGLTELPRLAERLRAVPLGADAARVERFFRDLAAVGDFMADEDLELPIGLPRWMLDEPREHASSSTT